MTLKDLADYDVAIRPPISIDYRGFKLHSCGAPSSGSVTLSTLKTIEGYNMSDPELHDLNTHRLDEAMRWAYAAHNELGDPDFVKGIHSFEADMLNEKTAKYIRSRISDDHTRNVSDYNPKGLYSPETAGTSHVVTADKSGMSISLTTTINLLFGSGVIVPGTGMITINLREHVLINRHHNERRNE